MLELVDSPCVEVCPEFDLTRSFQGYRCTNPRDHVFAFLHCPLGEFTAHQRVVKADYSLFREELWHLVACKVIVDAREGPALILSRRFNKRIGAASTPWNWRLTMPNVLSWFHSCCTDHLFEDR